MTRVVRFDAGTLQRPRRTSQGYLLVDGWASRTGILEYRNPDGSVRKELREDDAVYAEDSLNGFLGAPVTDDHPPEMVNVNNSKSYTKGTVVSVGRRDGEHVAVSMLVTDADLIRKMETGKRQLSTGYFVELDETPGIHPKYGRYDARQVRVGPVNHLAVVERGRAGTASVRMDSADVDALVEVEVPTEVVQRLDAIASRLAKLDAEWNEEDHPRDENGRFGGGGGGGGGGGERNRDFSSPSPKVSASKSEPPSLLGDTPGGGGKGIPQAKEPEDRPAPLLGDTEGGDRDEAAAKRQAVREGKVKPPPPLPKIEKSPDDDEDFENSKEPITGARFEKLVSKVGLEKANQVASRVEERLKSKGKGKVREVTGKAAEKFLKRERGKDDRRVAKKRGTGYTVDSAHDLHDAKAVPQSGGHMTLDEALSRIKELEAKLDAFEAAPAGEKCETCGEPMAEGHECAPKMDAADVARIEGERDAARTDADEAKKALEAASEAHKAELDKLRKDAADEVATKIREALDVLTKAATVLGKGAKIKLDGKDVELVDAPLRAVKCAVIKHVKGKTISAEKHDAYVDALFEDALDAHNPGAKSVAAAKAVVIDNEVRKDAEMPPVDPEKAALEANKNRLSSAWMRKDDEDKN